MPIIRYFVFIGSLLLALLFVADRYLAPLPDAISAAAVDRTIIRIHSARALPDKIVFDTSQPSVAPAAVALADEPAVDAPREAHAMMAAPAVQTAKPAPPARHIAERQRARSRHVARDRRLFALNQRNLFAGW